jgi:hypothetical protein
MRNVKAERIPSLLCQAVCGLLFQFQGLGLAYYHPSPPPRLSNMLSNMHTMYFKPHIVQWPDKGYTLQSRGSTLDQESWLSLCLAPV